MTLERPTARIPVVALPGTVTPLIDSITVLDTERAKALAKIANAESLKAGSIDNTFREDYAAGVADTLRWLAGELEPNVVDVLDP